MKKRLGSKIMACCLSAALCVSMTGGGVAFAAGDTAGKGTNWAEPTQPMTNTVTKNGVLYKVLTTWANAWSTSGPDYLGISNSAYYGNGANGNANANTLAAAKNSSLIGIWASAANESPNAYNWNTFYNLYASTTGAAQSDTAATNQSEWDSESGVRTPFKYRPEIIWFSNSLNATQTSEYVGYINQGKYYKSTSGTTTNFAGASEKDKYYVDGDENYNPKTIQPNNSNPYSFVNSAYELATLAKQAIAETASNKSSVTASTVNWKNMNSLPRTNRYTESVDDCSLYIEKVARGSMYYALSKINSGAVKRKKVAYVAYYPGQSSNNISVDSTHAVVAVYDYTENIGSGPMDGRASWSPLTVDQLSSSTVHTAQTGGQSVASDPSAEKNADTTYTLYTVTADDLASCDVIYSPHNAYTAEQWKSFIENNASTAANKQKASSISYIAASPSVTNGSNFTMEKLLYGCFAMDCIYPELFPNMMNSTYWYDNVYHLTNSALGTAMQWGYGNASLPSGTTLASLGSYSKATADSIYEAGYQYYASAKNTDATLARIAANKDLSGKTTHVTSGATVANYYGNFAPSSYWASQPHTTASTTTIKNGSSVKTSTGATVKVISTSSKTVSFTAAPKKSTVSVPATVKLSDGKTYKVTSIGASAFKGNTTVKKVTIGKNVKTIGSKAFYGCKNITSVTIGSAVTSIGTYAFQNCAKLAKLTIPAKVKTIGSSAFKGAKKLKTLTVKSTKLTKKTVKKSLTGSSVTKVKVSASSKKATNKKYITKYKKYFTKANAGKKVSVK